MKFKKLLPHLVAIVLFALLTDAFFSPLVFDGKKIGQSDVENFKGSSKEIVDYRASTGEEPLWTNSMFGGMPAYQISTLYPNNYVQYIAKVFALVIPPPATAIFICMVGFYFLLITLKVDPWMSIGGGIAFGFSAFFIVHISAGHNTQVYAISYMAPVIMGVLITTRGRIWLGGALTALALSLELYSNHLQITYYLLLILLFIGGGELIRLWREGQKKYLVKAVGILSAAVLLAILPNLSDLYLTQQYGKYSIRGPSELKGGGNALNFDYAVQYSYPKAETMTMLIPNFEGGASQPIGQYDPGAIENIDDAQMQKYVGEDVMAYFGAQGGTSGPVYVGSIICFLFVLGLFIVRDSIKWWLLGATVLSILLSWGSYFAGFSKFFFDYFPGYNKFRAVSYILAIAEVTVPILAMLALREIATTPSVLKEKVRSFYVAFALTGGISLLVWMAPSFFTSPLGNHQRERITAMVSKADKNTQDKFVLSVQQARYDIVKSDAIRSFGFILVAAALLFIYSRKPFGVIGLAVGMGILLSVDMYFVASRYLSDDKGDYHEAQEDVDIPQTAADAEILKDKSPDYRVLNLTVDPWADGTTSYWHKSLGGYHGAKLKRIQELHDSTLSDNIDNVRNSLGEGDSVIQAVLAQQPNINMFNTKYIINGYYDQNHNVVYYAIYNPHACGNAWFVRDVKMVDDADAELKAVKNFSPRRTAFVDKRFADQLNNFAPRYDSTASIKLLSYAPNDLKYESNSTSEQFAVFSEIYYDKGWDVYVDGQPSSYVRADYVLRAMRVPAGKHNIEFKFEPKFYYTGEKIALVGSFLLFIFIGGGIYMDVKEQKKSSAKKAA